MKTRIVVAVTAIFAFAVAGSFSGVRGEPQQESPKKGKQLQTSQIPPEPTVQNRGGSMGGMNEMTPMNHMSVVMQVDSMMQRMTMLMDKTQSYSKSFGLLAAGHHGADKKEILMMQRMSDSMGTMAKEIKVSLQQYKEMLEEETATEGRNVKAEVQDFRIILDGIGRDLEKGVNALETLQIRLGQG